MSEQQYQAEVMDNLAQRDAMTDDEWWRAQDAIQAAREAANQCPKCGAETEVNRTFYMNIETFVRYCTECEWEGKQE